jgi:hypothetical protein
MTTITLQRQPPKGKAVAGIMRFAIAGTELQYPSLENADYIIPTGIYPVSLTWSPKFKKLMPLIENVPDREGIRIHMGTKPEHSEGCILTNAAAMYNLTVLFNRVDKYNKEFKPENEPDEEIQIEISDPVDARA